MSAVFLWIFFNFSHGWSSGHSTNAYIDRLTTIWQRWSGVVSEKSESLVFIFPWLELTFLYSRWSNSEITVYAKPEDLDQLRNEYALNLTNHRYEIDWLVGMVTAQKLGVLGVNSSSSSHPDLLNRFVLFSTRAQKSSVNIPWVWFPFSVGPGSSPNRSSYVVCGKPINRFSSMTCNDWSTVIPMATIST